MILFVDDDELLHPLVGKVLQDAGHNLVFAADGERACALAREQPFDLILLDYEMPKMTGIDVLNHLKMMRTGPPPVIMLTARGGCRNRPGPHRGRGAGFHRQAI